MAQKPQAIRRRPIIFSYQDYCPFMADQISWLKATAPPSAKVTLHSLTKKAGLNGYDFLGRVLKGKRNLTISSIPGIVKALKLNRAESDFFTDLVMLSRAKNSEERSFYSHRLIKHKRFQKAHPMTRSQARYLSEWFLPAVRELVALPGFKEDPNWIAKRLEPEITPAQAQKAVKDLLEMGFLGRDEDGSLIRTHGSINTGDEFLSPLISDFHRSMARKGLESVDRYEVDSRNLQAITISLSEENRLKLWELMSRFRQEVSSLADQKKDPNGVYQVNLQFFPLAPKDKDPEGTQ